MKQLEIYIDNQRADMHDGESIEFNVSAQDVRDISKVFGDYSQSFTLPATKTNNKIFKHYYEPDLQSGYNANTRLEAFIQINSFLYRSGVVELESVSMADGRPKTYTVAFYGMNTSLKGKFGKDMLTDLDLSDYDHTYRDSNVKAGIGGYITGTNNSVIYPLISPVRDLFFNSNSNNHDNKNIAYHTSNDPHGLIKNDFKPALKVAKIIDAIEAKYSVTFNSDFFATDVFTDLYMWAHRNEGYLFNEDNAPNDYKVFNPVSSLTTGTGYDDSTDTYTDSSGTALEIRLSITASTPFQIVVIKNDIVVSRTTHTATTNTVQYFDSPTIGDAYQIALSGENGASSELSDLDVEYRFANTVLASTTMDGASTNYNPELVMADHMPEITVEDFLQGLLKMFNLVLIPTAKDAYDIEPLDDWYAEGATHDLTKYVKADSHKLARIPLYKKISFKFEESETILADRFRVNNGGIGYGDLETEFTFDGEAFEIDIPFEQMLFERLSDEDDQSLSDVIMGKAFDKDLNPNVGAPILFYANTAITLSGDKRLNYLNVDGSNQVRSSVWEINTSSDSSQSINFGAEINPYSLTLDSNSLYATYWEDYITDLFDTARRLWSYEAILPLSVVLAIKSNDMITIWNRNYKINSMKVDLTTGSASLELLNDV